MIPAAIRLFDCLNERQELAMAWKLKFFQPHTQALDESRWIVINSTRFDCNVEDQAQRADCVVEVGRSSLFSITSRPGQTVLLRNLPNVFFLQFGPRLEQRCNPFLTIDLTARF